MRARALAPPKAFAVLTKMLGEDAGRTVRVLRAFRQAISDELLLLDQALQAGDRRLAQEAAHRAAMACHLVGEKRAGRRLAVIDNAGDTGAIDPVLTQQIVRARAALVELIDQTSMLVESGNSRAARESGVPPSGEGHGK